MKYFILLALCFFYPIFPDATNFKNGNQYEIVKPKLLVFPIIPFNNLSPITTAFQIEENSNENDSGLDVFEAFKLYTYITFYGASSNVILSNPISTENEIKELNKKEKSENESLNSYLLNLINSNSLATKKVNVNLGYDKSAFQNPYLMPYDFARNIRWDISLELKY